MITADGRDNMGLGSRSTNNTRTTAIISLSATGSRKAPNWEVCPNFLAR